MSNEPLIAQMLAESEARIKEKGLSKDPSESAKKRKSKGKCSICKSEVYGNVDPNKILTCGYCVIALMGMEKDMKVWYRDKLAEAGNLEAARSIESFIIEEEPNGDIRPTVERKRTGKVSRNVNRRLIGVQKKRLPVGKVR